MVLDYCPFDTNKTNEFFDNIGYYDKISKDELFLDLLDNRFCRYIYKNGKYKNCICGTRIKFENKERYCSRHLQLKINKLIHKDNKLKFYCIGRNRKNKPCNRLVKKADHMCLYHIKNNERFKTCIEDYEDQNFFENNDKIFISPFTYILYKNEMAITIIDKINCDKSNKLIEYNIDVQKDNNEKEIIKDENLFSELDELIYSFKSENDIFLKKCKDTLNENAELQQLNCNNFILSNIEYMDQLMKEILKNKCFIPVKILLECIKSFITKFREFDEEIEKEFSKIYKRKLHGFFKSIDIQFSNDAVRYMKKADVYSIFL